MSRPADNARSILESLERDADNLSVQWPPEAVRQRSESVATALAATQDVEVAHGAPILSELHKTPRRMYLWRAEDCQDSAFARKLVLPFAWNVSDNPAVVVFSRFGMLATIENEHALEKDKRDEVVAALVAHGFVIVPEELAEQESTLTLGVTWRAKFFDYL